MNSIILHNYFFY